MEVGRRFLDLSKQKVNSLENRLSGTFKPIAPRREFVRGLGHRIQSVSPATFVDRFANFRVILLAIAAVVSFGVLVLVGVRALTSLFQKKPLSRA